MSEQFARLVEATLKEPLLLRDIAGNPRRIAERFGLNEEEARALETNDFDALTRTIGVDRSFRAANHDDAYLS